MVHGSCPFGLAFVCVNAKNAGKSAIQVFENFYTATGRSSNKLAGQAASEQADRQRFTSCSQAKLEIEARIAYKFNIV